jgi:tetratricopeptide (TPR) repeat protein
MPDPARTDISAAADLEAGPDRDARVEQLLLTGLDHYFGGRYDDAIHVWTRVLFLDRGHMRARAYIERARSALAERQRQSDELLHRGTAAFELGQNAAARRLLTAAVEQGAPSDVAHAYLDRLDRLASTARAGDVPAPSAGTPPRLVTGAEPAGRRLRMSGIMLPTVGALALTTLAWFAGSVLDLTSWPGNTPPAAVAAPAPTQAVPVPRPSDVALARARALFGTGRAQDALHLLDTIGPGDPNRPDADRLLADIQGALLLADDASRAAAVGPLP